MIKTTLVAMTKDGEILDVHPLAVANHQALGWVLVDAPAADEAKAKADEPAPKKKAKADE